MTWFWLAMTRKFTNFSGRSRRREYWWTCVSMSILLALSGAADVVLGTMNDELSFGAISGVLLLVLLIPGTALSVRRLHDIGRSGWWVLLGLTGIGTGVLMVIALFDSQPGSNKFGQNPKIAADGTTLDERPPSKISKTRRWLFIAVSTFACIATVGFGLQHWFMEHMDNVKAQGKGYEEAGKTEGQTVGERDCFQSAIRRHTENRNNDLTANVLSNLQLNACLKVSLLDRDFCDGVPAHTEIISSGQWVAAVCAQVQLPGDVTCSSLSQTVIKYCETPLRQDKVTGRGSSPV